jgi:transglutaminase-like putative cysteine protease
VSCRATYRVVHETHYDYSDTINIARQLAHLQPRATAWQKVMSHRLDIAPNPSEYTQGHDYFGNDIVRFAVESPHDALTVTAESIVEIARRALPPNAASVSVETALTVSALPGPDVDLDVEQYRLASPMVPLLAQAEAYARVSFAAQRPWLEAMLELTNRIYVDFVYDPKATTVTTEVHEVLRDRRGVCQDFAHLMISCLRSLGLAARYVSGYIVNAATNDKSAMVGVDASHAWVSAYCPRVGWVDFDPTNGKAADHEFITLGWGREFSDVSPLRGVMLGSGTQKLSVAVHVAQCPNES